MSIARFLEYTETHVASSFSEGGRPLLNKLTRLPCLFMPEGRNDEISFVGSIFNARFTGQEVAFEYALDTEVTPLRNSTIYANRIALDMRIVSEFSRNHWAVKEVDLYRFLLRNTQPRRQRPTVFQIDMHERIEETLVSAMMPFDMQFDSVYEGIKTATANVGLICRRADDIWENPAIIQDVVGLIDHSRIIICDCTGRNPNVFYEAGIAHTLGREVILITQNRDDIPFDLRHLRYIQYLNNGEGIAALTMALQARMQIIIGH